MWEEQCEMFSFSLLCIGLFLFYAMERRFSSWKLEDEDCGWFYISENHDIDRILIRMPYRCCASTPFYYLKSNIWIRFQFDEIIIMMWKQRQTINGCFFFLPNQKPLEHYYHRCCWYCILIAQLSNIPYTKIWTHQC